MLSVWWLGITIAGVMAVTTVSGAVMSRARSQSCADAVALALVTGTRSAVQPLLEALDVRVVVVRSLADTVTVEVDTPWGRASATAARGA